MPTRADAETVLIQSAAGYGAFLGLSAGMASPVASLAPAIAEALAACGVTPANPVAPTDADMARLPAASWPKFVAIAALNVLETASSVGQSRPVSQRWPTYAVTYNRQSLAVYLKDRRDFVRLTYGYGAGVLRAGTIALPRRPPETEF